jgi:hypothetical protein
LHELDLVGKEVFMRISENTVSEAFGAFHRRYVAKPKRAWDLDHHGRLWADSPADVESINEIAGFVRTLEELRAYWQIARGKGSKMMEFSAVLPMLRKNAGAVAIKRLSTIKETDAFSLFELVRSASDIKRVNGKPSLMAISKVLHFFNPRLFVIVDRAMVWDWTLAHRWLWEPIEAIRERIDLVTGCDHAARSDAACDITSYVAILIWSGELLRENSHIGGQFAAFLRAHTTFEAQLPADLETYEAAAVEWLLLGLVELPPPGVTLLGE